MTTNIPGQDQSSLCKFILKGVVLGCLFFFLFLTGLLLTAEVIKVLPSPNLDEKLRKVTRLNPFDDESWYALGRIAYYLGDYSEARKAFGRTLTVNRLFYPAWIDLMGLSLKDTNQGREIVGLIKAIDLLNPTDIQVHWRILLETLTLDKSWAREAALNEIRLLIPLAEDQRTKLFTLAGMLLGSDEALLTFVPDDLAIKTELLHYFLFSRKRADIAETLWDEICARKWKTKALFRTMIKGLFYNKKYKACWNLWENNFRSDYRENLVFNGGFEKNFLRYGFSWRTQGKIAGVERVRFVHFYKVEGRRAFSMEFDGEHNPSITNPYQYIYLQPGRYRLRALLSTKEVTGATGFYVEVSGPHFRATSEEVKGDTSWKKIELLLDLNEPGLYRLSLRRNATGKLNRFLGGKVFFDDVRLVKLNK